MLTLPRLQIFLLLAKNNEEGSSENLATKVNNLEQALGALDMAIAQFDPSSPTVS